MVLAVLIPGLAPWAQARTDGPMNPPPMAEPLKISVLRGDTIEIPLRASGRTPGQLRFLVREKPSHGTLGEIKLTSGRTARISYHQTEPGAARFDSFRFAVQAVDSPVSAPAEVQISIRERPPKLSVPESVDFGETGIGSNTVQVVEIKNTGGQVAKINARVEPPWRVTPDAEVTIPAGGSRKLAIEFAPPRAGLFEGRLTIPGFPDSSIPLTGRGSKLFEVVPVGPLAAEGASREFPEVSVRNLTTGDHLVQFSVPEGISEIEPTLVSGLESIAMRPTITSEWLEPVEGDLVIRIGEASVVLPLTAGGAPPDLEFQGTRKIDFGRVAPGTRVEQMVAIANSGGTVARLDAAIPSGLLVLPPPSTIVLPPGAEKRFTIVLETLREGSFSEEILFSAGEEIILPLRVQARVAARAPTRKGAVPTESLLSLEPVQTSEETPWREEPGELWEPPGGFRLVSQEPGTVEIGWTEESPPPSRYLVELRSLKYLGDDLPPEILWEPFQEVRFQRKQGEVIAGILRLPPDSSWTIRFVPVQSDGVRRSPSPPLRIASPPLPKPPSFLWLLPAAALAAAGYFMFQKIRLVRERAEAAERGRIARLEKGD